MKMPFLRKRSVWLCSMAFVASPLTHAAETLVVTARADDSATSPTTGYTARTSTGATKTDRPLITTGQAVSVVTRQQMEDQGAMDVNQEIGRAHV